MIAFEMPVEIVVETEAGFERFTIDNTRRNETFVLRLQARPIALELDPDRWILRDVNVAMGTAVEPQDIPAKEFDWSVYPNPAADGFTFEIILARPDHLRVRLIDSEGRVHTSLADKYLSAGLHRLHFDLPAVLPPGSYRVEVRTDTRTDHRGLVVIR